jgi:predicted ester cyclase
MPPTNRSITAAANVILHVADGRVTKLLGVFDEAGLMRQLGA